MAIQVRNTEEAMLRGLIKVFNDNLVAAVGSNFHACATADTTGDTMHPIVTTVTISAANASDLPTSLTLVNATASALLRHFAAGKPTTISVSADAHKTPDTTLTSYTAAVDLATGITLANSLKAKFNTHIASTTFHYNADGTNTIATANATDLASLQTLLNAMKTAVNAHMASGATNQAVRILP